MMLRSEPRHVLEEQVGTGGLTMHDDERDVELHEQFLEGPIWDDLKDAVRARSRGPRRPDDVEGHASGFGWFLRAGLDRWAALH